MGWIVFLAIAAVVIYALIKIGGAQQAKDFAELKERQAQIKQLLAREDAGEDVNLFSFFFDEQEVKKYEKSGGMRGSDGLIFFMGSIVGMAKRGYVPRMVEYQGDAECDQLQPKFPINITRFLVVQYSMPHTNPVASL